MLYITANGGNKKALQTNTRRNRSYCSETLLNRFHINDDKICTMLDCKEAMRAIKMIR